MINNDAKTQYNEQIKHANRNYERGDYDGAVTLLQNAIKMNKDWYRAYYYLGLLYLKKRPIEEAVACFKKAYDLIEDKRKIFPLIIDNLQQYNVNIALDFAENVLKDLKNNNVLCLMLAVLYSKRNEDEKANIYFLKSIFLEPDYYVAYCEYIIHLMKVGDYQTAYENCKILVELKPDEPIFQEKLFELDYLCHGILNLDCLSAFL